MNTRNNCPICSDSNFTPNLSCKDYTVSHNAFQIVSCSSCGFQFTNPIPPENEIGQYYESEDYISHSNTNKGLVNKLYQAVRNYTIGKKMSLLTAHSDGKKLLDIGCGTGEFLAYCSNHGFDTLGIEPSPNARAYAKENHTLNVLDEPELSTVESNSFDHISMWHVMEHVYHLQDRVSDISRLLKPGGHAFIAVPNCKSYDAKYYKEYWAAYDVPRHLYHFQAKDMKRLFEQDSSFSHVETLPMVFDSFYVSMLSEKYKTGKTNLVRAFYIGLKSNLIASRRKNDSYSSQIYVFRKN